jgi:hypothetical protein
MYERLGWKIEGETDETEGTGHEYLFLYNKMVQELSDHHPLPDIHQLFSYYNDVYFQGKLSACTVAWSSLRMSLYVCLIPLACPLASSSP